MPKLTYYQVLGIQEEATEEEIRRSARKLSEKYHPDRVAHLDVILAKEYEAKMKEINEAKQTLCDPVARSKYNNKLKRDRMTAATAPSNVSGPSPPRTAGASTSTANIKYAPPKTQAKRVDVIEMELVEEDNVTLECPFCSEQFTISKKRCEEDVMCPACGKGGRICSEEESQVDEDGVMECPRCRKRMRIPENIELGETVIECPYCGVKGTLG